MSRSNNYLYVAIILLLVGGSFVFTWKYTIPKYQENQSQEAQIDQEIKASKTKLESLKTSKNSLDQLGETVDQVLLAVPTDEDIPNLITEIEAIGAKNQIAIPGVQIGQGGVVTGGGAGSIASTNEITISFLAGGSFEGLTGLMSTIEKDLRFMNIDNFALNKTDKEEGSGMSVNLQITAYKINKRISPQKGILNTQVNSSASLNNQSAE